MNTTISVIIPVYNGKDFVEKALRSVIRQEYPAHEIIVVDDGSTDDTHRILDSFGDRIILRRIKNQGAAVAMNVGLSIATGECVAFLDQDDIWFANYLKVQAEVVRKYPKAGFFCCDFVCRYPFNHNRLQKHFLSLRYLREINFDGILKTNPFELLIKENFTGAVSSVVIRKEVIDQVGKFDKEILVEDYDYWLRCAKITKFVILSRTLLYKRIHKNNFSNNKILMYTYHKKALQKVIQQERAYIETHRLSNVCQLSLAKTNYDLGNIYYETGNTKEAFRLYFEGLFSYMVFANILLFIGTVIKKVIRLLTFNKLSKENIRRIFRG